MQHSIIKHKQKKKKKKDLISIRGVHWSVPGWVCAQPGLDLTTSGGGERNQKKILIGMRWRQWNLAGILTWTAKEPSNGWRTRWKKGGKEGFRTGWVCLVSSSLTHHLNRLRQVYTFHNCGWLTGSSDWLDDDGLVSFFRFGSYWTGLISIIDLHAFKGLLIMFSPNCSHKTVRTHIQMMNFVIS